MISTASKPYNMYLFVAALVAAAATPACYTLLQHPRVAEIDYQRPEGKRCFECHTDEEIDGFHRQPNAPDSGIPWWYDRYWYYDASSDLETVPIYQELTAPTAETEAPPSDQIKASTGKQKTPAASTQENKEKVDDKAKDKPDKTKRPVRPKGEKKKKNKNP